MPRAGVNRGTRTELGSMEDDSYTVRMTPFKKNSPKLQTHSEFQDLGKGLSLLLFVVAAQLPSQAP